ncbi:MAG TPA: dTDP-4-dehydrorhamnose reductase [Polyangiaceae bacterium LLY-WYZ-14_1]|nr:dTDP-4-dehydrorhamnose reductase [Polyangiaceae bacterium LLY-WYZ-14_1]
MLLLGHRGMLGRAFAAFFEDAGVPWEGADRDELDLADRAAVDRVVTPGFATVVNCAAFTDVDGAEAAEEQARRVNAEAVAHLARRCAETGGFLVHFSTDYVFDGQAEVPVPVDAPRSPLGVYGRTKAEGEAHLEAAGIPHLLVRTSWLYAPWGKNFVRTMSRLTRQRAELRVVADQRGRPTEARHLARTTWALRQGGARGAFHVTDGGETTWVDLARFVARELEAACTIHPCTTAEWNAPAPRPAYSVLDLSRTEAFLGRAMPPWPDAVRAALRDDPDAPLGPSSSSSQQA